MKGPRANGRDPELGSTRIPAQVRRTKSVRRPAAEEPPPNLPPGLSCLNNFNVYFTLGMVSFFAFWSFLLVKMYFPQDSVFGRTKANIQKELYIKFANATVESVLNSQAVAEDRTGPLFVTTNDGTPAQLTNNSANKETAVFSELTNETLELGDLTVDNGSIWEDSYSDIKGWPDSGNETIGWSEQSNYPPD